VALAREGFFGPDPHAGLATWNSELLIWVAKQKGIEVFGSETVCQSPSEIIGLLTNLALTLKNSFPAFSQQNPDPYQSTHQVKAANSPN